MINPKHNTEVLHRRIRDKSGLLENRGETRHESVLSSLSYRRHYFQPFTIIIQNYHCFQPTNPETYLMLTRRAHHPRHAGFPQDETAISTSAVFG